MLKTDQATSNHYGKGRPGVPCIPELLLGGRFLEEELARRYRDASPAMLALLQERCESAAAQLMTAEAQLNAAEDVASLRRAGNGVLPQFVWQVGSPLTKQQAMCYAAVQDNYACSEAGKDDPHMRPGLNRLPGNCGTSAHSLHDAAIYCFLPCMSTCLTGCCT